MGMPKPPSSKPLLSVSEAALEHMRSLIAGRDPQAVGVRVKLRTRGCSGLSYVLEYVDQPSEEDTCVVLSSDLSLFIQAKALMFLVGTHMDYQTTPTRSGFVFVNPQEKGRCGCGSSFHV